MLSRMVEYPFYISPWLPFALRAQAPEATDQGKSPNASEVAQIKVALGQQEFAF